MSVSIEHKEKVVKAVKDMSDKKDTTKRKNKITKDEYITNMWHKRNRVNCFVS